MGDVMFSLHFSLVLEAQAENPEQASRTFRRLLTYLQDLQARERDSEGRSWEQLLDVHTAGGLTPLGEAIRREDDSAVQVSQLYLG